MVAFNIPAEYGYVIACALAFYFQQAIAFVIPVGMARKKTGLKPPSLYPRDSEIKALKLSEEDVGGYMRAQVRGLFTLSLCPSLCLSRYLSFSRCLFGFVSHSRMISLSVSLMLIHYSNVHYTIHK
jgi:hypothetical protein